MHHKQSNVSIMLKLYMSDLNLYLNKKSVRRMDAGKADFKIQENIQKKL